MVRELGSERKLHCVLSQKCDTINLTNIGETLLKFSNCLRGQYRGKIRFVSNEELAYIAGFLDGDGCIMAQLVRRKDYIYGYQVRTSVVFYQKQNHQEILHWLKAKLNYGYIRNRNDGMSEYTIVGFKEVSEILEILRPYLRLKKTLANRMLELIRSHPGKRMMTPSELIRVSELVDETAKFTYSKKRTNTCDTIRAFLKDANLFPVETELAE